MKRVSYIQAPEANATRAAVLQHLEELNTPRSLSIFLLMKGGHDFEVVHLDTDPTWFLTAHAYLEFALPTSLVSKWVGLNTGIITENVAISTFFECEELCRQTNRKLRTKTPCGRVSEIIRKAKNVLERILPEIDIELLESIADLGGWGPGVTSSCKGRWLSTYNKLGKTLQATAGMIEIVERFRKESPTLSSLHREVKLLDYNSIVTVPKNAKTDRTIAVEPSANAFFQKGAGQILRTPLKRLGIDLSSQRKNQEYARRASLTNEFATIDLSSASDTISIAAVEELLPPRWVALLRTLRSPYYKFDGKIHRYHKWSSMGNGYTFELESLIFGSLCYAICGDRSKFCVYGDDIIVPVDQADILVECLEWLGFSTNKKKTFLSGPFRESCGSDYFLGVDVRPFFLKEIKENTAPVWANSIRTFASYKNFPISKTWHSIRALSPQIPLGPGGWDGVLTFWSNEFDVDPFSVLLRRRPYGPVIGYEIKGWRFHSSTLNPSKVDGYAAVGAHLLALRQKPVHFTPGVDFTLRVTARKSGKWKRCRAVFSEHWPDLRPV